jgi:DNA-binding FrmR family transcriptional regulator
MTLSADNAPAPRRVDRPDKDELQKRLARIEGQVRGLREMIEADRYCVDVITQVQATRSALAAVAEQLLDTHLKGCVARALQGGDGDTEVDALLGLLRRFR